MLAKFGHKYRAYMKETPMFFPHMRQWRHLSGEGMDGTGLSDK